MENLNKDTNNSPLSAQPSTEEIMEKIETVIPDGENEATPVNEEKVEEITNEKSDNEDDSSTADDIETVSP